MTEHRFTPIEPGMRRAMPTSLKVAWGLIALFALIPLLIWGLASLPQDTRPSWQRSLDSCRAQFSNEDMATACAMKLEAERGVKMREDAMDRARSGAF